MVPFAKDMDGTLQCVMMLGDGRETVVAWDANSGEVQEDLKVSFAEYLESIRDKMLAGGLEYDEDMGLMTV